MDFETYRSLQQETHVDGLKLSYVDIGTGPTVLLVHGIPVWGYLWKDVAELMQSNYRLIIPDLPGYGYSDHRDEFDRGVDRQANWLLALLDELDIDESIYLVGHDIGGAVAQQLAVHAPARFRKLILVDSVVLDSWPAEPMIRLGNPKSHYKYEGDALARTFIVRLPGSFHNPAVATTKLLTGWMTPYMSEAGKLSLIRCAAALNTNHTMMLTRALQSLGMPIHLVWARQDQFQPLTSAQRFQELVPNSTLTIVEACDHFMPLEKPAALVEVLAGLMT